MRLTYDKWSTGDWIAVGILPILGIVGVGFAIWMAAQVMPR